LAASDKVVQAKYVRLFERPRSFRSKCTTDCIAFMNVALSTKNVWRRPCAYEQRRDRVWENDHQPCVARVCRNQANDSNVCYKFSGQKKTYQGGQISDSSKIQVVKSDVTEMLLYFENDKVLTYFAFPVNKNRW